MTLFLLSQDSNVTEQPVGESNPSGRLERPPASPNAEPAKTAGQEALESSSAVFQTAANPSQLPTRNKKARHHL